MIDAMIINNTAVNKHDYPTEYKVRDRWGEWHVQCNCIVIVTVRTAEQRTQAELEVSTSYTDLFGIDSNSSQSQRSDDPPSPPSRRRKKRRSEDREDRRQVEDDNDEDDGGGKLGGGYGGGDGGGGKCKKGF
jgi:hypothetical protein